MSGCTLVRAGSTARLQRQRLAAAAATAARAGAVVRVPGPAVPAAAHGSPLRGLVTSAASSARAAGPMVAAASRLRLPTLAPRHELPRPLLQRLLMSTSSSSGGDGDGSDGDDNTNKKDNNKNKNKEDEEDEDGTGGSSTPASSNRRRRTSVPSPTNKGRGRRGQGSAGAEAAAGSSSSDHGDDSGDDDSGDDDHDGRSADDGLEEDNEEARNAVVDEGGGGLGFQGEPMVDDASGPRTLIGPRTVPETYPEVLVLPVTRNPIFPKFLKVVEISDQNLIAKIKHLYKTGRPWAGAFLKKNEDDERDVVSDISEIRPVGTFVQIMEISDIPRENKLRVLLQGHRRIYLTGSVDDQSMLTATVDNAQDQDYDKNSQQLKAMQSEVVKTIRDIVKMNPLYREAVHQFMDMSPRILENTAHLCDFGAALTSASSEQLQEVLEEMDIAQRLSKTLELLKQEYLQTKLQNQISKEVEDRLNKAKREHLLHEQLKIIKRELGLSKDDKDALAEKFRARLEELTVPESVKDIIDEELNKLGFLEPSSSEFSVTRNYLDWLTMIPWGKHSDETLDIDLAVQVLDEDHYGMKDVKDRVLEFIAVGSLRGDVQGKILCFVGPPGVGKTSIAKSIARSLHREYYRFSVGGLHDVAEIKGHRRTYIGAMPGKPIQCLKKTATSNPLVLIDEIDKIGRGHNGDPTSALLELLDPEQNHSFLDHYLDVPVDMSKVLFVCTANVTDTIPGPLLDRMEVIELAGYIADEKLAIAKNYLIPAAAKASGVEERAQVTDAAVLQLIGEYCRESGVRNLQKHIEKIFRKAALRLVKDKVDEVVVDANNLADFVGPPRFSKDRLYDVTPPGVVTGLAWTALGGTTLFIETVADPVAPLDTADAGQDGAGKSSGSSDRGSLRVTGQLGDVMKESSQIAYTFAKHYLHGLEPTNRFFWDKQISLHVPEGATPKDGPSAGCTMVTALLSLATNKPVRKNLAMTGEISLTGKVMRVGGIKEKVLAARRDGITCVILPETSRTDYEELPADIREEMEIHFASTYDDVYAVAFGDEPSAE